MSKCKYQYNDDDDDEQTETMHILETKDFRIVGICPSQEWLDNWSREHGYPAHRHVSDQDLENERQS